MVYKKYANCEIMGLAHQAKESFVEIEKKISLVSDDMSSIADEVNDNTREVADEAMTQNSMMGDVKNSVDSLNHVVGSLQDTLGIFSINDNSVENE